ncbi:peptidase M18 [Dipodascopsis uninucleata]
MNSRAKKYANDFVQFVNASPSPYHVVENLRAMLEKYGFTELSEKTSWEGLVRPGGKYYVRRNGSSIVAFGVGGKWKSGGPLAMAGAHTDSPCLKIKPLSKTSSDGYTQVGVELYGGGIWHTWFDRDLSVAGRVYVEREDGKVESRLVKIDRSILRVPTLAIHLDRDVNSKFEFNKETHLTPIGGLLSAAGQPEPDTEVKSSTNTESTGEKLKDGAFKALQSMDERHDARLLAAVAEAAKVTKGEKLREFELVLYDTQPSGLGGLSDEFIHSARLDNQMMAFCGIQGLIDSVTGEKSNDLANDESIRLTVCFDHEEIGSESAQGARSTFLPAVVKRICGSQIEESMAQSFFVSADMAHAVHPNYGGKYEGRHRPAMNAGPVVKINGNQRYATTSAGIVLLEEVGKAVQVPLQLFVVRNDSPCGSTIGPMISALVGTRTIDIGNAQLSMHSIRETCGSGDVVLAADLFSGFFSHYAQISSRLDW